MLKGAKGKDIRRQEMGMCVNQGYKEMDDGVGLRIYQCGGTRERQQTRMVTD